MSLARILSLTNASRTAPMTTLQEGEDLLMPEGEEETEEQKELRLQEEELMRENEEALRMDLDGTLKAEERDGKRQDHSTVHFPVGDLVSMPPVTLNGTEDGAEERMNVEHERKGVLSH
jgi:[histone H3]-lysine36 N-trimethyltransferase